MESDAPRSSKLTAAAVESALRQACDEVPGVGEALIDEDGTVLWCNARSAFLFLETDPESCIGKNVVELFGKEWATRRLELIKTIARSDKPLISRHIRFGRRIQSTGRRCHLDGFEGPLFLVSTIEGEHDPDDPNKYTIVESDVVHLGPLDPLTRRELEVLALIGNGMTTAEIAKMLYRSPRTIERHLDSIRAKLGGANRVKLAELAQRAGLRVEDADKQRT